MSERDEELMPSLASSNLKLTTRTDELTRRILDEEDIDKLNDLTALFELNRKKKSIARLNRLSKLEELIDAEVMNRVEFESATIENKELTTFMNTTQNAINSLTNSINQVPAIQINNTKNEVNINQSGLDRDSRQKVIDTVNIILNSLQINSSDNIIDVEAEEED